MIPPIGVRVPTFNWYQTDTTLTISVYTRRPEINSENVIAQIQDNDLLQVLVLVHDLRREEHVFQGPILLNLFAYYS